jgi:2-polyprenyl-6-methoxyphenol hydroxylase-like FAD-dependent oxidoreductase
MVGPYALAGELARSGPEYAQGFERYEALLRPFLETKQRGARNFARAFAPKSRFGLSVRDALIRAMAVPGLSRIVIGRDIEDRLTLPEYHWG